MLKRLCVLLPHLSLAASCGGSDASSGTRSPPDSGADDVLTDGPSQPDASNDAGDAKDAWDAESDVAEEASMVPAHCAVPTPLPSWAEAADDAGLIARCALVQLRVEAYDDGVLRLRYQPPGEPPSARSWAVPVLPESDDEVYLSSEGDRVEVCTRWMRATIAKDSCRITIDDAAGFELIEDGTEGGFSAGSASVDGTPVTTARLTRSTPATEQFYGFGEKTGPLARRGTRMAFWNTDAFDGAHGGFPPDADPLYLSVPFFVALRNGAAHGVLTDSAFRTEMDMASSNDATYRIETHAASLDQWIIAGPSMAEVLRRSTAMTGRVPMPPRWSLGYHQCRWGYSPASAFEAIGQAFRDRGIPADGLWLDIQHMEGFRTFTWDPNAFPDPAGMIARLASQGYKITVIADPGIKVDPGWDVYDSGLAGDHFLRHPNGDPFTGSVWPGESVFPDLTAAATRAWWADHVGRLVDQGVRGIWLDVNEPTVFPESGGGSVPNDLPVDGDGTPTTMAEAHNVYALNEARATYEGMKARAPDRRPFLLTRAGFAGTQRYAAVWTGDGPSTWSTLQQTLPMLLNLGLSGIPFAGSDVGGYSGGATPELFARWMALGSVSGFFRGHVTQGVSDQEPWAFGFEVEDISRAMIQGRYELLPYFYSLFDEARRTGAPLLRPMVYAYQSDPTVRTMDDQAMLGPFLLVAPVLKEGATERSVYLPAGRWFEVHSGAAYDGPATVQVAVTLAAMPTFVREGAILPRGPLVQYSDEAPLDPLRLDVYPAAAPSTFTYYEDDGDGFAHEDEGRYERIEVRVEQTASGARLSASAREGTFVPASRKVSVRFHRVDHPVGAVRLDGSALVEQPSYEAVMQSQQGWWWDEGDLSLVVVFVDRNGFSLEADYDPSLSSLRPPVTVTFRVTVPEGTPQDPPIHVTLSSSGWTQQALSWTATPNVAEGQFEVPRGEWFFYKYTRGDWDTVEKWSGCEEADDRYGFGQAHPGRDDVVYAWRDWCGG